MDTDSLVGAAVGLMAVGVAAGVANKMMGNQPAPRRQARPPKPMNLRPKKKDKKRKPVRPYW